MYREWMIDHLDACPNSLSPLEDFTISSWAQNSTLGIPMSAAPTWTRLSRALIHRQTLQLTDVSEETIAVRWFLKLVMKPPKVSDRAMSSIDLEGNKSTMNYIYQNTLLCLFMWWHGHLQLLPLWMVVSYEMTIH